MDIIKNLRNITENNETLITIFVYDKIASSFIKYLESQLEKAKNIQKQQERKKTDSV